MHSEWIIWGSLVIMAVTGLFLGLYPDKETQEILNELEKKE